MEELREKNNTEESREVVGWYVPRQGREIVGSYVQPRELPAYVRPRETVKKRSRRGLWIFLSAMALVVILLVLSVVLRDKPEVVVPGDDGSTASSIVDISGESGTKIPRDTDYTDTRLSVQREHGEELTVQQIYAKCNPSTVLVVAEWGPRAAVGTGVIMSADGYIITNAHVLAGADNCWIALDTGKTYDARLVGYDADEDIAVLRAVDAQDLPVAEFGDSEMVMVGDDVYAIGNPLGVELRGTLTDGIISAINRDVAMDGITLTVLQTTAEMNNGNSGGPLINRYGQVIGINTLKMSDLDKVHNTIVEGLGFALPISDVCFVVNDIIATGEFHGAPMLGITVITVETADGTPAVMIYEVAEGFDAAEKGLQPNDVILKANGQELYTTADLLAVRRECRAGDTVALVIYRDGEILDFEITLKPDNE